MIAEVYPLRRLSRTMKFFDYEIPEGITVKRGSFVEIPLRLQKTLGVVRRVKDVPARGIRLKKLLRVLSETSLRDEELSFFEETAHAIVQPAATLLSTTLPSFDFREIGLTRKDENSFSLTIPASEAATVARLAKQMAECRRAFVQVPDLRRTAAVLAHYFHQRGPEKRVLICPHVHDVRVLTRALFAFSPFAVTGEESSMERSSVWQTFRHSSDMLLITTRTGLLYPDAGTACVVVVRSGHPDHAQHDRNPRLDSRCVMDDFSERFTTNLFFFDVYPRADDLWRFGKDHLLLSSTIPVSVIDASHERPVSPHAAISSTSADVIRKTLQRGARVLIVYNKKGYAVRLRCQDCDHRFVCSVCGHTLGVDKQTTHCLNCHRIDPIPLSCPSCRSSRIQFRGFGNERLVGTLQEWFPDHSIALVDKDHPNKSEVSIILATRYYLENLFDPLHPETFGCLVHLDPDRPLLLPTFRASEQAVWSLSEWAGAAQAMGASCYAQTQEPDLFAQMLRDPLGFLTEELKARESFGQPPFARWFKITIREEEKRKRELEEQILRETLNRVDGVCVSPDLCVRVPHERVKEVRDHFRRLDDRYVIDTNLFS